MSASGVLATTVKTSRMKRIFAIISAAILTLPLVWSCTEEQETPAVKVQSISIEQGDLTLEEGESVNLTAIVLPEDATDNTVSWSSSNDDIVMVSSNGKAKAMSIGGATITAKAGDKSDFITITVVAKSIPNYPKGRGVSNSHGRCYSSECDR